jgi:tetratricopeptide (TPR) repeat protein
MNDPWLAKILGLFVFGVAVLVAFPHQAFPQVATSAQEQAELLVAKGILDAQAGKTEDALGFLRQAVVSDPHHIDAWMLLGQLALDARQYGEAAKAFHRVRELAPDQPGLNLLLGRALFHAGKVAESVIELDAALADDPDDAIAHLYRGLAMMRLGRTDEAVEAVQKAAELDPQFAGTADLISGVAGIKKGDWAAAERALEAATTEEEGSPLAELATQLRSEVAERRRQERPLKFHIRTGVEWDTNVAQVESDLVSNNESLVSTGEAGVDFQYRFNPRVIVSMGGLVQEIYPYEQKDLDIQGGMGYMYSGFKFGPVTLLPQYIFGFYRLDNKSFFQLHSVRPTFVWSTFLGAMRGFYEFQTRKFFTQEGRDGELHGLGLAQRFTLGKLTRWMELGYRYDVDQTEGPDFLRYQHILGGRFSFDLPWSLTMIFKGSYTFKDYRETDSLLNVERDEEEQRYEVKLRRRLNDYTSIVTGYAYLENESNVSFYDTIRNRYIVEVEVEF